MEWNIIKQNETEWNRMKWNETKWIGMKQNDPNDPNDWMTESLADDWPYGIFNWQRFWIATSVSLSKVVLFTTLELYSEEATINHHGFARSVAGHSKEAPETGSRSRGASPHQIAKMFGNIAIYHNTSLTLTHVSREADHPHSLRHLRRQLLERGHGLLPWILVKTSAINSK